MKLWGGRFTKEADRAIEAFTASLPFDQRMAAQDIRGSIAHARMLGHTGIVTPEEAATLVRGLEEVAAELTSGARPPVPGEAEDIHSMVEQRLREKIGPLAGKLHTARSRNDQVATDLVADAFQRLVLLRRRQRQQGQAEDQQSHQRTAVHPNPTCGGRAYAVSV
ncbi:MAG: hypothetical protein K6U89_18805 [Chloroflexi bacterium]|nr:hypothetical protein [Chloroflexota bacterium]